MPGSVPGSVFLCYPCLFAIPSMRDSIPFRLMLRYKHSRASGSSCVIQDCLRQGRGVRGRIWQDNRDGAESAVEVAMPMGNVAIADPTENTAPSRQQKSIQYP